MLRLVPLTLIALAACGSPPPDTKTAADPPAPSGARGAPTATAAGAEDKSSPHMTLEQHQAEFLSGCQDGTEYCQCGWEQFSTLFTAAEMDADTVPDRDARMAELKKRVGQNCAKKLPEPRLKEMIVSSCADDPKFRPFCECLFTEQRKKEPITVFLDAAAAKTPEAEAIRRAAGKQCSPTVPEAFQQQIFVNACKKDKDALQPFCGCLWKTARAHLSTGEIGAGFLEVDQAKLEPLIEKSCGKLRPAK